MLPMLIAVPMVLAAPPVEAAPEYRVCPVSGYAYHPGTGIFLTVRGHRYWVCHSTHAEALAKHPDRYLDGKGVPKILPHSPKEGTQSPHPSSPS